MNRQRAFAAATAASLQAVCAAGPACAATAEYTYVRMSLTVPWTLYLLFLAAVLIPFVVMIVLAWRGAAPSTPPPQDPASAEPPGDAR